MRLWIGAAAAVSALGIWTLERFIRYLHGAQGIERHHVESAALLFVVAGIALRAVTGSHSDTPVLPARSANRSGRWLWLVLGLAACALYTPALSIGFLSDDHGLSARAASWQIGAVTSGFFRPLPLAAWALVLQAGGGALWLHLVNVILHGTNAFLTIRVAEGWGFDRGLSTIAGLVLLTMPIAVEPVAWTSGIFDVAATFFVLQAVVAARRYEPTATMKRRLVFGLFAAAALLAKETAVVLPIVVAIDAWVRRALRRPLATDVALTVAAFAAISAARLVGTFGVTAPIINRYRLQTALFETFGTLAVPWHSDVKASWPWLPFAGAAAIVALALMLFLDRAPRSPLRRLSAATAWILVSVAPVFPILYIAPDLEASRYLYLASVGWSLLLLGGSATMGARWRRRTSVAALVGLCAIGCLGVRLHLRPWVAAAAERDRLIVAVAADPLIRQCAVVSLEKLPDSVGGAYLFRVDADKAIEKATGIRIAPGIDPPCKFEWDAARGTFEQK